MSTSSRRKVKVIGTENYINQSTGEINEMQIISVEERDANFHKLWLGHILQSIDLISNQKTKVAFWILENLNSENQLIMTQRAIAKELNVAVRTVNETIKALVESDFLRKQQSGVYQVNPDMLFKGGKNKRMNVLLKYKELSEEGNLFESEQDKPKKSKKQKTKTIDASED